MHTQLALMLIFLFVSFGCAGEDARKTWTDSSGKFQVEGTFVKCEDYQVTLDTDSRQVTLPLTRLCQEDQAAVKQIVREKERIPNSVVEVLEVFDKCRQTALSDLEQAEKDSVSKASKAANDEELRRLELFRNNPTLFPGGFRSESEGARAAGQNRIDSIRSKFDAERKKLTATMVVPRFRYEDVEYRVGLATLGLYEGRFSVEKVLDANTVLVRALGRAEDDPGTYFCLKQPGGAPIGPISFDSVLHYITGQKEIRFDDGAETTIRQYCVVEPFSQSMEELEEAWKKWKSPASPDLDPEREAQRRLNSAKLRFKIESKREAAQQMLREIIGKFPGTIAAAEAQELIEEK